MSDTKVVVELAGVNLPLGQFMELACKRMTQEMAHETGKWESLQRLGTIVDKQKDEIRALRKQCEKLENTIDTLCKVMGVGRQRFPHTPDNNTSTPDEEEED